MMDYQCAEHLTALPSATAKSAVADAVQTCAPPSDIPTHCVPFASMELLAELSRCLDVQFFIRPASKVFMATSTWRSILKSRTPLSVTCGLPISTPAHRRLQKLLPYGRVWEEVVGIVQRSNSPSPSTWCPNQMVLGSLVGTSAVWTRQLFQTVIR